MTLGLWFADNSHSWIFSYFHSFEIHTLCTFIKTNRRGRLNILKCATSFRIFLYTRSQRKNKDYVINNRILHTSPIVRTRSILSHCWAKQNKVHDAKIQMGHSPMPRMVPGNVSRLPGYRYRVSRMSRYGSFEI